MKVPVLDDHDALERGDDPARAVRRVPEPDGPILAMPSRSGRASSTRRLSTAHVHEMGEAQSKGGEGDTSRQGLMQRRQPWS